VQPGTSKLTARSGEPAYSTGDLSGIRIRSYYRPSPAHPRGTTRSAVIQVAASLAPLGRDSLDVLLRLLATGLLGTIVTALGAGWLARSSLAPVAEIAAQARTVTSRGPRPQITVHADVIELQDLIQVLNEMLGRMERALSQQRRIISDVGHELRTPITVMRGEVEVALRGTRQPEQYQAMLRSVLEEVDRLALMGEELIVLARCEAGELTPQAVACDLKDLVAQAVAEARRKHPHEPIEVDLAQVRVNADPRLLGMAIDQLIDNALRHTPSGTPIRLTTWEEGAHACLAVEDAGPGVPEESLSQLTEPFFRTDRARGRGGAGLGLTVVAAIAALHRGDITPSRGSLGGLRVEVALPTGIEGSILRG